jgi:hypothetical protein
MTKYDYKVGLQKTLKNVSIILTPGIALELLNNISPIIPSQYLPMWQVILAGVIYFIKNASDNGFWKKK